MFLRLVVMGTILGITFGIIAYHWIKRINSDVILLVTITLSTVNLTGYVALYANLRTSMSFTTIILGLFLAIYTPFSS